MEEANNTLPLLVDPFAQFPVCRYGRNFFPVGVIIIGMLGFVVLGFGCNPGQQQLSSCARGPAQVVTHSLAKEAYNCRKEQSRNQDRG